MSRVQQLVMRRVWQAVFIILLLPLLLPLTALAVTLWFLHRVTLYLLVWLLWLPKGKDILFVYSDSPIWKEYMIQQLLPLMDQRAVVLNWSERSKWRKWSLAVRVLRSFGGGREFNPMVILFRPLRRAQTFRFWSAFKEWKHGETDSVERLRNELFLQL
ncbi:MAG: hypothetical protein WAN69_11025 [Candidatus Korobacteraceae bacterium]